MDTSPLSSPLTATSDLSSAESSPVIIPSDISSAASESSNASRLPAPTQDDLFYFQNVVFLAENTLFRVPRYGLEDEKGVFASMFSMPPGAKEPKGSSDENPVVLSSEITAFDFKSFLKAVYPQIVGDSTTLTIDEWMSVLKLSTMWGFSSLQKRAAGKIETHVQDLRAVDLIVLARAYRVPAWLMKGYDKLARRKAYITPDERERLGLDTFFRLVEIREKSWRHAVHGIEASARLRKEFQFTDEIQAMFKDELVGDEEYRAAHGN